MELPKNFFDGLTAAALLASFFALLKFAVEYTRDNRRKRMELYLRLRDHFRTNENFSDTFKFLDNYPVANEAEKKKLAHEYLKENDQDDRSEFAAFLEDVAMAVSSGELRLDVAHYMFGYYVIRCWDNDPFWTDLDKDKGYWALLGQFVEVLKDREQKMLNEKPQLFGLLRF